MIVNLRGPSGSGKSFPGFALLRDYGPGVEITSRSYFAKTGKPLRKDKLVGHWLPGGLILAGRYRIQKSTRREGAGWTGGLDGWIPVVETQRLMTHLASLTGHMFCESLMLSGTFPRWNDWALEQEALGREVVFATLDTPLEKCVENVLQRNGGRPVKEHQMASNRRSVVRAARKFAEAGRRSVRIDHRYNYEQVRDLLLEGGWDPNGDPPPEGPIVLEAPLMHELEVESPA
jgi:hypothetical protein